MSRWCPLLNLVQGIWQDSNLSLRHSQCRVQAITLQIPEFVAGKQQTK